MLIDDGELIASAAGQAFADMEAAMIAAVKAASDIAAEQSPLRSKQILIFAVREEVTGTNF